MRTIFHYFIYRMNELYTFYSDVVFLLKKILLLIFVLFNFDLNCPKINLHRHCYCSDMYRFRYEFFFFKKRQNKRKKKMIFRKKKLQCRKKNRFFFFLFFSFKKIDRK